MKARRALGIALVVMLSSTLLSGCSPADRNALTRVDGQAAVRNCGTYLDDIEVRDAATGRLVWVAKSEGLNASVGRVVVGQLPVGWSEVAELLPDPRPTTWDIAINQGGEHLIADDEDLVEGSFWYEGRALTEEQFRNDVCEEDGGWWMELFDLLVIAGLVIAAAFVVGVIVWYLVSGRRVKPKPPGWYVVNGNWRWWDGSGWR